MLPSFFTKSCTKAKHAALKAELLMQTLVFIDRVREKDFVSAVQLLKQSAFKTPGASVPIYDCQ